VDHLGSILVVAERTGGRAALRRALILARHFRARIELFLCDAEHAYALRHLYDRRGAEEARSACLLDARRYLEALRSSVVNADVEIEIDAACDSPAYEGIVRKVLDAAPDLVVKEIAPGDNRGVTLATTDWHLIRTCPAPLMLTHGRAWHPVPRFAAAVDVSGEESPGLARLIAHTAEFLKGGCGATLDLVYSEREVEPGRAPGESVLGALADEIHVDPPHVHLLRGRPEQTLPRFTDAQDYDLFILGALTHQRSFSTLVGTLTERLIEGLNCDCVLLKPEDYDAPFRESRVLAALL
jgi:universal stress protein E